MVVLEAGQDMQEARVLELAVKVMQAVLQQVMEAAAAAAQVGLDLRDLVAAVVMVVVDQIGILLEPLMRAAVAVAGLLHLLVERE
jgi:hypothetical protein